MGDGGGKKTKRGERKRESEGEEKRGVLVEEGDVRACRKCLAGQRLRNEGGESRQNAATGAARACRSD